MDTITALQQLGLSEKEAKIYLAALSLGTTSIAELAQAANVKRPTAYLAVEALTKRNFLVAIPHGNKTRYQPQDPAEVTSTADEIRRSLLQALPELQARYVKSSKRPRVRFYEGKDKLIKVYDEIFCSSEVWAMFSYNASKDVLTDEDDAHFLRLMIRHNCMVYDILENTRRDREFAKSIIRARVGKPRFLPKNTKVNVDILVYGNKVALVSFENVTATVIEDQSIATAQKIALQLIWNSLPADSASVAEATSAKGAD